MNEILEYIEQKIFDAPIINYPYPHLLISDFFPNGLYSLMMELFPFDNVDNAKNYLARENDGELQKNQCDVWGMVRDKVYPYIMKMLERKFEKQIKEKIDDLTKYNYFLTPPLLDNGDANFQLLQRTENFSIPPHIHAPSEYLSVLHYLPKMNGYPNIGTQMYPLKKSYERNISWNEYPEIRGEYLGEPIIAPYISNSAIIWVSDFKAIHGRTATGAPRRYIYAYKLFNPECVNWNIGFIKVRQEV